MADVPVLENERVLVARQEAMRRIQGNTQLSEAQANRLIRLYGEAETEIQRQIEIALVRGTDLKNLTALRRNVGIIRGQLLAGGRTWCQEAIPLLYRAGAAAVDADLEAAGLTIMGFGGVHQQAMNILADSAYQRLLDVDQLVGRRVDDIYREAQLEAIRGQVTGYNTWKQTAQILRENLAARGITGFVDRAGRQWNMTKYVEMVARTAPREALRQGTAMRILEHGRDLVWITGGVSKVTCEYCRNWVGKTVSLTGGTPGYPTLASVSGGGHMFAPNCTHGISVVLDFETAIAEANAR